MRRRSVRTSAALKTDNPPAPSGAGGLSVVHLVAGCPALFHELDQFFSAAGVAQLVERLGLDLAHAFARHVEDRADLLQRAREVVAADAEAQAQHLLLAVGEGPQHLVDALLAQQIGCRHGRVQGVRVVDEVAEGASRRPRRWASRG